MSLLRIFAAFTLAVFSASLLPLPSVSLAASTFTTLDNYHQVKNITKADTNYATSTSADPGNSISFYMKFKNTGVDIATRAFAVNEISNYTYTAHSARWAWNGGSNTLNGSTGEVMFSPHYLDSNANGVIDTSDIRLNKYGMNSAASAGRYLESSTVVGGDYDDGVDLTDSVVSYIYITGGNSSWAAGELAFVKGPSNGNTAIVEAGDIRVIANGSYLAGSVVVSTDTDMTTPLTQAANLKRIDDGNEGNNTLWPFDEGGFPLGDLGVNKQVLVKQSTLALNMAVAASVVNTLTISASNASPASTSNTSSLTVSTIPSISGVSFSPSAITNDGASSTTVTVNASDKNGLSDIASVTINLSTLGGSATHQLYDNGANGDATANDGVFSRSGITTTVTSGNYTSLTATVTDSTSQTASTTGSLLVQPGGTPTITLSSTTPSTIGASATSTVTWQANEPLYRYDLYSGGCGGSLLTGTNVSLGDGTAQVLAAGSPVSSVLDNSNFGGGANSVYICGTDADGNVGQVTATVTKDTTAPTVTAVSVSANTITTGQTSSLTWNANEAGTYSVRIGSCSGAQITGANASGSYTSGQIASTATINDLAEGANTIYACVTDSAGNTGSATGTITRDTIAPDVVSGVALVDSDATHDGADGYDFTVSWNPAANDSSFQNYRIYLLPAATTLNTGAHAVIGTVTSQSTVSWTGTSALILDSAGAPLTAGNYRAWVVAMDTSAQTSTSAVSSAATIVFDDLAAPTFISATTIDTNTLKLIFNEPIGLIDPTKISATGLTVNTAYNSDGFTSGVKVSSSDARQIFVRISTVASSYATATLNLAACAVRDQSGTNDINEAGNCGTTGPSTNAIAAVSGLTIADGTGPTIALTTPAASGADNASIAVTYSLSETAATGSVRLRFTATGGTADSGSPHTIVLSDALVGGDAEASGSHSFSLNGSSFTSSERASDLLVSGTIYTVELSAYDSLANAAAPITNANWTYNLVPPSAPVTTQSFSSPTSQTAPQLAWSTVSGASYRVELSLAATAFAPSFQTQSIAVGTTTWTIAPALSTNTAYAWRVIAIDAAGNESAPSNQQTFTLDTQTNAPTISLRDQSSSSQTATNSQTVNVVIDAYSDATHYLLSETQSTQPAAGAITAVLPGPAPQTVSFSFASAVQGVKTLYVWVRDALGNVSAAVGSSTITLDTTAPANPIITASDTNAGAAAGKTNAATITIAITGDTDATAWCVKSVATGGTPTTPTELACSISGSDQSASGWVTSRPTTHTLASTGTKSLSVWTRDSAGNLSAAAGTAAIDYSSTVPPDPTLTVTDQTSGSSTYTDAATVTVSVGNDVAAWKWIVSNTASAKPAENAVEWSSEPTTLALTGGDGAKTVYAWIKDSYGNVSANQVARAITLDTTLPTIATKKTQDLNGNGQIDAVQITLSESISDSTITRTNFALGSGYTLSTLTGSLGSISFTSGVSTGSSIDDNIFYLAVTEIGTSDTSATPTLAYTAGTLADFAGNKLATQSSALSDGIAPVPTAWRVYDTNANGFADQARVTFSEALAATTATAPWTLANVPSSGTLASVSVSGVDAVITLTQGSAGIDTTAGAFTIALTNTTSAVKDAAGNAAASFPATAVSDAMGPVLTAANYISTGTVASDSIILSFSELLDDTDSSGGGDSVLNAISDLVLAGGGSITNSSLATGDSVNDNSFVIELNSGDTAPVVDISTLALSAGAVADSTGNASTGTTAVTIGGGLIINEINWAGSSSSDSDEWIELRNLGSNTINFDTKHICLFVGGAKLADLTGGIGGNDHYIISRYTASNSGSALNVPLHLIPATWQTLPDSGLQISLYSSVDSSCTAADTLLDRADDGSGAPFAGLATTPPASMERNVSIGIGTSSSSWHNAVASIGFDNTFQKGTPGSTNIADATAPTIDTATRFPGHQTLLPSTPGTISVSYADNAGGLGVDTAAVTMEVDLNGDGDYADASEGVAGICSGARLTATATGVICRPGQALAAGRHSVRVTVPDLAANSSNTSWDFWVDAFSMTVENLNYNFGRLTPDTGVASPDNTTHTKITIRTYGAGVTLFGTAGGALTSGAANVAHHSDNAAAAGSGWAWRVKEGVAGAFGNYFNWATSRPIATKSQFSSTTLASTNALQTYTFYIQHFVSVPAMQAAGVYTQGVAFTADLQY